MKFFSGKIVGTTAAAMAIAVMAGCSQQARKAKYEAKGDKYFDAGQYAEAEVEYLNAAKLDPDDAHALTRLGTIYLEDGKYMHAFPVLSRAKNLNTNDLNVRFQNGFLQWRSGFRKEARLEALAILDKDPKYSEAAFLLAEAIEGKDIEDAQKRIEHVVQQTGVTAESEIALGTLEFKTGNLDGAQKRFIHAQSLDVKRADAFYGLGMVYWRKNDLTNADHFLKQGADLSPMRSIQRLGYADFKTRTGRVEEGKQMFTEMTRAVPDCLLPWLALAEIAIVQRNLGECQKMIGQVMARDPDNFQAQLVGARI